MGLWPCVVSETSPIRTSPFFTSHVLFCCIFVSLQDEPEQSVCLSSFVTFICTRNTQSCFSQYSISPESICCSVCLPVCRKGFVCVNFKVEMLYYLLPLSEGLFIVLHCRLSSALFRDVSTESREFEDMVNILTSSYFDTGSAAAFTYCKPRLVYSELPEKEVRAGRVISSIKRLLIFSAVIYIRCVCCTSNNFGYDDDQVELVRYVS